MDPISMANDAIEPGVTRGARPRDLLLVALVTLACALLFVGKEVHQDDWAYLSSAELVTEHGFSDAQDQTTTYQGIRTELGEGILHGPAWTLLLIAALKLGGGGLLLPHLLSVGFLVLLALSTCSLAARLGAAPRSTALALALSPTPLVLSGGLMTDLPMVACYTAGLACMLRGLQEDSLSAYIAAGLFGILAALTRFYASAAMLAMFAVAPLLLQRGGLRAYIPLGILIQLLGGFLAWGKLHTGTFDFERAIGALEEAQASESIHLFGALLSTTCALGGIPIGWWIAITAAPKDALRALRKRPIHALLFLTGLALGAYLALESAQEVEEEVTAVNRVLRWVFLMTGACSVLMSLTVFIGTSPRSEGVRGWLKRHGANVWLACSLLGFLVISIFFVPFGSTRYTLPCMPPLFLLAGIFCARNLPARASVTAAGVSAALGLMCAEADRRAAQIPQRFASMYSDHNAYEEESEGSRTWIHGELSFRWFLEREAGLEVIASDSNDPKPGDRILRSEACTPASIFGREGTYLLHEDLSSRLQSLKTQDFEDPWPVRIHNGSAGAGFYAYTGGGLPYAFSSIRLDQIGVLAVLREPLLLGDPEDMPTLATAPAIMLEGAPMEGQASIEALSLEDAQPQTDSILFLRPGLASWPSVLIPDNCLLQTRVLEGEECWRLNGDDPMPGPGAIFRMYANDVLVAEMGLDSRRTSKHEGWKTLNADLSRWSQQEISLSFEVAAWQPPADLDEANADMCAGIIAGPELTWP